MNKENEYIPNPTEVRHIIPIEIPKNTYNGELDLNTGTVTIYPGGDNELYKVLDFLCKIAKEKDIHIDFSPITSDYVFPSFKVIQYRTNPENGKSYKISQIIDIDDLLIENVTLKQIINELVEKFDEEFNKMFKEENK